MPPAPPRSSAHARWPDLICLGLALILPLLWMPAFHAGMGPEGLCDEPGHLGAIYSIAEKKPLPADMPMLPGYHYLVNFCALDGHPTQKLARQVSAGCAILATLLFALAWRGLHPTGTGAATLLFALLPIFQPYTGMAYTEAAAVATLLATWWAHAKNWRSLAAVFFLLACLVRQTNAVWGGFLFAREFLSLWRPTEGSGLPFFRAAFGAFNRTAGIVVILLAGAGVALWHGSLTVGKGHGNQLQPNIATLHFAGMLALLLALPWVFAALAHAREPMLRAWKEQRRHVLTGSALGLLATGVLTWSFANPHEWNRELYWEGVRFTLLRNWPLVWADHHVAGQVISSLTLVLLAVGVWRSFRRQRYARELWLTLFCGALILASNRLVEPRYFITPAVMLLLFLEISPTQRRWLLGWFALIGALHAPFIARGLSLW